MTTPGVHLGLDETTYHADRDSLSASGMKLLLKAPALYRWRLDHPEPPTDHFDIGTAVHCKVLGTGAPTVVIDVETKRGKAWTEPAEAARAEGKTPLTKLEAESVDLMAEKILGHRTARRVLTGGDSEVSAFWHDEEFGVTRRARFDHLTGGIIGDLKTTRDAHPRWLPKAVVDYGYDLSAANYLDVAAGVGLDIAALALVFVDKKPPHPVVVADLDGYFLERGRRLARRALEMYRDCRDADLWPGYLPDDTFLTLTAPAWADRHEDYS